MGTWGDGLYDNDGALDLVAAMTEVGVRTDAATLVARIGLGAWLDPTSVVCSIDGLREAVEGLADGVARLPSSTRESLAALLADPEASTRDGSRPDSVRAALGGYCDGPRFDALLRFVGAQPVIDALGEEAAAALDAQLAPSSRDLYEVAGGLAALGIAVELAQAGLWRPGPARVAEWGRGFAAVDEATTEERSFWDDYCARVRQALALLE